MDGDTTNATTTTKEKTVQDSRAARAAAKATELAVKREELRQHLELVVGGEKGLARHVLSGEGWKHPNIVALLNDKWCGAFRRWVHLGERCLRLLQETTDTTYVRDAAESAQMEERQEKAGQKGSHVEQEEEQGGGEDVDAQEFLAFFQRLTRDFIEPYVKHYDPRNYRGLGLQYLVETKIENFVVGEEWKKLRVVHSIASEAKEVGSVWEVDKIKGLLLGNIQSVICKTATGLLATPPGMWFDPPQMRCPDE